MERQNSEGLSHMGDFLDLFSHQVREVIKVFDVELNQQIIGTRDRVRLGEALQFGDSVRHLSERTRFDLQHEKNRAHRSPPVELRAAVSRQYLTTAQSRSPNPQPLNPLRSYLPLNRSAPCGF